MRRRALAGLVLALALGAPALAREVPFLSGRVVDEAGILHGEVHQRLEQKLAAIESQTTDQVAVLTIPSLEGESLEDYSLRVASTWKLGQKGKDNGVLLLVATQDRKMRIEVGYGLEPKLTDALCGQILDNLLRPKFRAGDYDGGIEAGVDAIASVLGGHAEAVPKSAPRERPPLPFIFMFLGIYGLVTGIVSLVALFTKGGQAWFLYVFLMPFHLLFPGVIFPWLGATIFLTWLVGFPLFRLWFKHGGRDTKFFAAHPGWNQFASSSGSGGGWSSGGGGGFSGGGGSFGGGGSSSSW